MLTHLKLSLIALALFVVANNANAGKAKPAADFFPLRVGNSWTYRNTSGGDQYSLKVLSEEKQAAGSPRYLLELLAGVKIHQSFSKETGWVLLHEERYPEHEGLQVKYEPPKQYLRNPLVAGMKWEWSGKDSAQSDVHESSQVVGFEKVTVPAGRFRAMKVVSQVTAGGAPMTKTYWYAGGVGLVKTTTEGGKIKYGSELTDYSFKKKARK